jgi:hypothetical protein
VKRSSALMSGSAASATTVLTATAVPAGGSFLPLQNQGHQSAQAGTFLAPSSSSTSTSSTGSFVRASGYLGPSSTGAFTAASASGVGAGVAGGGLDGPASKRPRQSIMMAPGGNGSRTSSAWR